MDISQTILLLCGAALFLFGMSLMGDGLKKVSGSKLEPILYKLSATIPRGVLLGTGVTAVIQSSCATAIMTVGFVNSGMMKVRQGIGVILGAILGTSITGWVICLSYIEGAGSFAALISSATLTGIVAVIGTALRMFSKKQSRRHVGDICLGFAVLMQGMSTMSAAVSGLGEAEWFTSALTTLSNPVIGILIGAAFTAVLQSASAAVGIVQALSMTGVMSFSMALPLLMGIAFGASAPVLLSAIDANIGGKRTALVYPVATGFGVLLCASLFYIANAIFSFEFMSTLMNPFSLAMVNSVLRLVMVAFLMPFTDVIEGAVSAFVPEKSASDEDDPYTALEERFINYPALAIEQCRQSVTKMATLSESSINDALALIDDFSSEGFETVSSLEKTVDKYEDGLGTYIIKLTGQELTQKQNADLSKYLRTLSDFERISDHALNLAENAKEICDKGIKFSESACHELDVIRAAVGEAVKITVEAFVNDDTELAKNVEPLEELIDDLCDKMKLNHVERLARRECTINQGFVFNDMLTNFERVSDHCSNIALAMVELGDAHRYLDTMREKQSAQFERSYKEYARRFAI